MNAQAFVDLVTQMRLAQTTYFKRRPQSNLQASIELEQKVDQAIREGIDDTWKQLELFAAANPQQQGE